MHFDTGIVQKVKFQICESGDPLRSEAEGQCGHLGVEADPAAVQGVFAQT